MSRHVERQFNKEASQSNKSEKDQIRKEIEKNLLSAIQTLEDFKHGDANVWSLPTGSEFKRYADAARTFIKADELGINEAVTREELLRPANEILNAENTMS